MNAYRAGGHISYGLMPRLTMRGDIVTLL